MIGRFFPCFFVGEEKDTTATKKSRKMGGGTSKQAAALRANQSFTRLDGSRLRQLVANEPEFKPLCEFMFKKYDTDKDGSISKKEIKAAILGMRNDLQLPPPVNKEEEHKIIDESFKAIDSDSDGKISEAEFENYLRGTLLLIAQSLEKHPITVALLDGCVIQDIVKDEAEFEKIWKELFDQADVNKDGILSKKEVKPTVIGLAEMLGIPPPETSAEAEEMVNAAFAEIDKDESGTIQKEEFESLIRGALLTVAERLQQNPITIVVQE